MEARRWPFQEGDEEEEATRKTTGLRRCPLRTSSKSARRWRPRVSKDLEEGGLRC